MKINRRIIIVLLIVSAALWGLALASLNGHSPFISSASAAKSPPKSDSVQDDVPDAIALIAPGLPRDLESGDAVPLAGDVMVRLDLAKSEKRFSRRLELYLYHKTSSQPIDDATVRASGQMRYMSHGDFVAVPMQSAKGHYVLLLPFAMDGEWEIDFEITISGKPTKMRLEIDLYE